MIKVRNDLITIVADIINNDISKFPKLVETNIEIWFDEKLNSGFTQPTISVDTYTNDGGELLTVIRLNPFKKLKEVTTKLMHELAHLCCVISKGHSLEFKQFYSIISNSLDEVLETVEIGK